MNYKQRASQRKIHNTLIAFFWLLRFKSLYLSFPKKIVTIGIILGVISLFLPWIVNTQSGLHFHSFTSLSWNIWFLLALVFFLCFFIVFSHSYKEKLKFYSDLSFKNHFIIISSWAFIVSVSIIALSFIQGLQTYLENMLYGQWIILSLTSGIILLVGGYYMRKDFYNKNSEIILNKVNTNNEMVPEKNNMKLPF